MSTEPFPPHPIAAMFKVSLGALYPRPPRTCLGIIVNPRAVAAEAFTNSRRLDMNGSWLFVRGSWSFLFCSG